MNHSISRLLSIVLTSFFCLFGTMTFAASGGAFTCDLSAPYQTVVQVTPGSKACETWDNNLAKDQVILFVSDANATTNLEFYRTGPDGDWKTAKISCLEGPCNDAYSSLGYSAVSCRDICEIRIEGDPSDQPFFYNLTVNNFTKTLKGSGALGAVETVPADTTPPTIYMSFDRIVDNKAYFSFTSDEPVTRNGFPFVFGSGMVSSVTDNAVVVDLLQPGSFDLVFGPGAFEDLAGNQSGFASARVNDAKITVEMQATLPQRVEIGTSAQLAVSFDRAISAGQVVASLSGQEIARVGVVDGKAVVDLALQSGDHTITITYDALSSGYIAQSPSIAASISVGAKDLSVMKTFVTQTPEFGAAIKVIAEISDPSFSGTLNLMQRDANGDVLITAKRAGDEQSEYEFSFTADWVGQKQFYISTTDDTSFKDSLTSDAFGIEVSPATVADGFTASVSVSNAFVGDDVLVSAHHSDARATGFVELFANDISFYRANAFGSHVVSLPMETAGVYTISAKYHGSAYTGSFTETVGEVEITTKSLDISVISHTASAELGDNIQIRVDLSDANFAGALHLVGQGAEAIATLQAVSGQDSYVFNLTAFAIAEHSFHIVASEDARYAAGISSREIRITVNPADVANSFVAVLSAENAHVGDTVTVRVNHDDVRADGDLQLLLNDQPFYTSISSGTHTVTIPNAAAGTYHITAVYAGSSDTAPFEQKVGTLTLALREAEISLITYPQTAISGDRISITAQMSTPMYNGTLRLMKNGGAGLEVVNELPMMAGRDTYSFETSASWVGESTFRILAVGDNRYDEIISSHDFQITIAERDISGTLIATISQTDVSVGDVVSVDITHDDVEATGVLAVLMGDVVLYKATSLGTHKVDIPTSDEGNFDISVLYSGSATTSPFSRHIATLQVSKREVGIDLSAGLNSVDAGQNIALRIEVSPDHADGTLTVLQDQTPVGTINMNGKGAYDFSVSGAQPGAHVFAVSFIGSASAKPATSNLVTVIVEVIKTRLDVVISNAAPAAGDIVEITAKMSPNDAEGAVTFFINGTDIGSSSLTDGAAVITWAAVRGSAEVVARFASTSRYGAAVSEPVAFNVMASTAELYQERKDQITKMAAVDTARASRARLRLGDWMMRDARTRLRANDAISSGYVSTMGTPLSYNGDIHGTDGRRTWNGSFYGATSGLGYRRYIYGDFDLAWQENYGTTAEFNAAVAFERTLSDDTLAGIVIGAEAGKGQINSALQGSIETLGYNVGIYGAKRISSDVIVDGFVTAARLFHSMDLGDDDLTVAGDYASTSLQFGATFTGEDDYGTYSIAPELSMVHGMTWVDEAIVTATSQAGDYAATMDAQKSNNTRVTATPRLEKPIQAGFDSFVTVSPHFACERQSSDLVTVLCGTGIGAGVDAGFAQGAGRFTADVDYEKIGGQRRAMLSMDVTLDF